MKVTINYFGQLRQLIGLGCEELEPAVESLFELLVERANHYGSQFKDLLLDENGKPRSSILLVLNGVTVDKKEFPQLHDGDEIDVMTPIAGG